ncbi:ubiquitinyl hydrolase 1 [Ranunculus cassubicifolius]
MDATSSTPAADVGLSDGAGKYKLKGFLRHMGSTEHYGHYVAHVNKDGRWVNL